MRVGNSNLELLFKVCSRQTIYFKLLKVPWLNMNEEKASAINVRAEKELLTIMFFLLVFLFKKKKKLLVLLKVYNTIDRVVFF